MKYSPFDLLTECVKRLEDSYRLLKSFNAEDNETLQQLKSIKINGKNIEGALFPSKITQLGLLLQEIVANDTNAFLAALYLNAKHDPLLIQAIYTAILCDILSKALNIADVNRLPLILAALTHDIGMLDYHQQLNSQTSQLSKKQRLSLHEHPNKSVTLLQGIGVTDKIWLNTVAQHHERADGSGYPRGLTSKTIITPSKMLALSDIYAAMVRPRSYRGAIMPEHALRQLFVDKGKTIDKNMSELLIKYVGIYPPGAIVELKNGEIGVVKSRTYNAGAPIVLTCMTKDGAMKLEKTECDSSEPEYKIIRALPRDKYNLKYNIQKLNAKIQEFWLDDIDMHLYN